MNPMNLFRTIKPKRILILIGALSISIFSWKMIYVTEPFQISEEKTLQSGKVLKVKLEGKRTHGRLSTQDQSEAKTEKLEIVWGDRSIPIDSKVYRFLTKIDLQKGILIQERGPEVEVLLYSIDHISTVLEFKHQTLYGIKSINAEEGEKFTALPFEPIISQTVLPLQVTSINGTSSPKVTPITREEARKLGILSDESKK